MRIVFMGASELGWECCRTLLDIGQDIVGILSIPKEFRISWSSCPVMNVRFKNFEDLSRKHRVPLHYVTTKMADPAYKELLQSWRPDLLVVIGWYYMVPRSLRDLASLGAVGIHASLLPRYRGGAPLVWAMIRGEAETGVTLFHFEDGVDTGDVIAQRAFPIFETDLIGDVIGKSLNASVDIVREYVPKLANGTAPRMPQQSEAATVMPQRGPDDGLLDWTSLGAAPAYNWVRAQSHPYPGAFTLFHGTRVIIWRAEMRRDAMKSEGLPGTVVHDGGEGGDGFGVLCADGLVLNVREIGLPDGQVMGGSDFCRNERIKPGDILGARSGLVPLSAGAGHDL